MPAIDLIQFKAGIACLSAASLICVSTSPAYPEDIGGLMDDLRSQPFPERPNPPSGGPLFRRVDPRESGVVHQPFLPDLRQYSHELLHLSVMGGICSGDIDNDGWMDFYVTSPRGGNRLFRNLGGFKFVDATIPCGLEDPEFWGTGAVFVDIDNDGDQDLFAAGYQTSNRLWINQGTDSSGLTRFVDEAGARGLDFTGGSMGMAFADYDRDGDLDGYLFTTAVPPPPELKFRVEFEGRKPVIPDELREYWALIYLPGDRAHRTEAGQFDRLYRNDGDQFVDVTRESGIDGPFFTLAAMWLDFDGDHWPDVYVANDYLGPDRLYRNNKDGTFTNIIADVAPHTPWSSMGTDLGDINNDGWMDWITTDMLGRSHYRRNVMLGEAGRMSWFFEIASPPQYVKNSLYLNGGNGQVMEVAYQMGIAASDWTWSPRFEDFDEDGFLDLFLTNGMIRDVQHADLGNYADTRFGGGSPAWAEFWAGQSYLLERNAAFRNMNGGKFEDIGSAWGLDDLGVSLGSTTVDLDRDGDLDLLVYHLDEPVGVYENQSNGNRRIVIALEGRESNRFGLGSFLSVETENGVQSRYLTVNRGWLSGVTPLIHFGLGQAEIVRRLEIHWPAGGRSVYKDLQPDQFITIMEPDQAPSHLNSDATTAQNPVALLHRIHPVNLPAHQASNFDDLSVQPLLPTKRSQANHAWAWGDVNNDGKDDLYLGGNEGQPGRLFLQTDGFEFNEVDMGLLELDSDCQDVDARFFHFNADGFLDLYVVSGGVDPGVSKQRLTDRLYLNDGKGGWIPSGRDILKDRPIAGSCVAVSQGNPADGGLIFVGGGSIPGRYPLAQPSRIYGFKGGELTDRSSEALTRLGLVADAEFGDWDGDGDDDLVVAEEWGRVHVLLNQDGDWTFLEKAGFGASGRWRVVKLADLDGDGDPDILAGNIGDNHRFKASADSPQRLYYSRDTGVPMIEAYRENGIWFPHKGLDELARVFPFLKKEFINFHHFASTSLNSLLELNSFAGMEYLEVSGTQSGVFFNRESEGVEFRPFPAIAQISCVNDLVVLDVNEDGYPDCILAQNDFTLPPLMGRLDGGLGLVMLGNGSGSWHSLTPAESGISIRPPVRRITSIQNAANAKPVTAFAIPGEKPRFYGSSDAAASLEAIFKQGP